MIISTALTTQMGQGESIPSRQIQRDASMQAASSESENINDSDRQNSGFSRLWNRFPSLQRVLGLRRAKRHRNDEGNSENGNRDRTTERSAFRSRYRGSLLNRNSPSLRSLSPPATPRSRIEGESQTSAIPQTDRLILENHQQEFERAARRFRSSIAALRNLNTQNNQSTLASNHEDENVSSSGGQEMQDHGSVNNLESPGTAIGRLPVRSVTSLADSNMEDYTRAVMNYINNSENTQQASVSPEESQLVMLSRFVFSVASGWVSVLMNSSSAHQSNNLEFPSSISGNVESGNVAFDEFLSLLHAGNLVQAMNAETNPRTAELIANAVDLEEESGPINLFRTFRFDNLHRNHEGQEVIPIIIVGIRSLRNSGSDEDDQPSADSPTLMHPSDLISSLVNSQNQTTSVSDNTGPNENVNEAEHISEDEQASTATEVNGISDNNGSSTQQAPETRNNNSQTDHQLPRSWAIYVREAFVPQNHPVLRAPSLFTDSPTYEDMLLLNSIIGIEKPPVASQKDLEKAGGVFPFTGTDERCLVCLSNFELNDECRRLKQCNHFFHRECIDQWLTSSQNSCPLCRTKGVASASTPSSPKP